MNLWVLCAFSLIGALLTGSVSAQTTRPATTRATTKPDPQADPVSAVKYLLKLVKDGDFVSVRSVNLRPEATIDLRREYALWTRWFHAGGAMEVVDFKRAKDVASVICATEDKQGKRVGAFSVTAVLRFDEWKVETSKPNLKRFSPDERDAILSLDEWRLRRLMEVAPTVGSATQPAR